MLFVGFALSRSNRIGDSKPERVGSSRRLKYPSASLLLGPPRYSPGETRLVVVRSVRSDLSGVSFVADFHFDFHTQGHRNVEVFAIEHEFG